MKKYWKYILAGCLFLIPLLIGIVGGDFFVNVFDYLYGFILNVYYHNFIISFGVAYTIMLIMMIYLYFKNKRSVGLLRYVGYFTLLNIFMILVYILSFIVAITLSRFTIYFDVFGFFRNLSFISANNFGNFYTFEVSVALLVLLGIRFFGKMNSVEKEVNVHLMEKMDNKKMEKTKLPYFGSLDEYYNDLITGMKDEFSEKLDHPTVQDMNVYFPEVRMSLNDKEKYLKSVEKELEETIISKFKEEGIENLELKKSVYDEFTSDGDSIDTLELKSELASKVKYTMYKNLREIIKPMVLFNHLYQNGKSGTLYKETQNNRLDEVIMQKSILDHFGIDMDVKYKETASYFNIVINQINELFSKLINDKYSFLKSNKIAKEYNDFDKSSLIIRNINIIDELVIDSRMLIFSPKGIYSVENLKFNNVSKIEISKDGQWDATYYDGSKKTLKDIMVQTKNHIVMEKNHLNKQLKEKGLTLDKEVTIMPLVIIHNENIDIINDSDLLIVKEHEYVSSIQKGKDTVSNHDLEIIKDIFAGGKEIIQEYNQVDYVKYFEFIIDAYFRYMDELKYISRKLEYIIDVLKKENVISDNYLKTVERAKPLYYSYDYMMYLAHQKHYKNKDNSSFDKDCVKMD